MKRIILVLALLSTTLFAQSLTDKQKEIQQQYQKKAQELQILKGNLADAEKQLEQLKEAIIIAKYEADKVTKELKQLEEEFKKAGEIKGEKK